MKKIDDLIDHLNLEQIELNLFRGYNKTIGSPNVFGGQVLAQALNAANRTVPDDRYVHSLHAYFVLAGNLDLPILYEVERIRDGRSFTTRNIKAIQNGNVIFNMIASFQIEEEGYNHQIEMPAGIQTPEKLMSWDEISVKFKDFLPNRYKTWLNLDRPIEFKPVELTNPMERKKQEPFRNVWLRSKGKMPEDKNLQQQVLAYASDYNLLASSLLPHGDVATFDNVRMASIDHAMWFHRDFNLEDWHLYTIDSPSTSNARGFTRGNIFNLSGKLVASVVQEGLIRPIKK